MWVRGSERLNGDRERQSRKTSADTNRAQVHCASEEARASDERFAGTGASAPASAGAVGCVASTASVDEDAGSTVPAAPLFTSVGSSSSFRSACRFVSIG